MRRDASHVATGPRQVLASVAVAPADGRCTRPSRSSRMSLARDKRLQGQVAKAGPLALC